MHKDFNKTINAMNNINEKKYKEFNEQIELVPLDKMESRVLDCLQKFKNEAEALKFVDQNNRIDADNAEVYQRIS